jgi:NitT/TauT family transport system substrate-binding protein
MPNHLLARTCVLALLATALLACTATPAAPKPAAGSAPTGPGTTTASGLTPPSIGGPGGPSASAPVAPTRLRVAYTAISGGSWPTWIAQDAGFYLKHGIEAELEYIASSGTAMQALLAGEVPIIPSLAGPTVIQAALGGGDAVAIGAINNTVAFYLMTIPEIRDVADLRGKRLGISRFGSASDSAARFALPKWSLRPDEDVAIVQVGGIPEIIAAMQSGAVHGGVLSSPTDIRARQVGFVELADLGAIGIDYPQTAIGTTRAYLRANEDLIRRFLRANVEAIHLLKTDPEQAKTIFGKWADITDRSVLDATYRAYIDKVDDIPYIKPAAMQSALEEVAQTDPRAATARPEDFIDNRYVQELETSGFVRQVWGR